LKNNSQESLAEIYPGIKKILWFSIIISVLPIILVMLGADFSSAQHTFDYENAANMDKVQRIDQHFHLLNGAFTHTLLEWSAFSVAIFTVLLALANNKMTRSNTTLIIAFALFMSGFMDAFHTLAADRLIPSTADTSDLVPFTWAICRIFNALIMKFGVLLVIITGIQNTKNSKHVIFTCIAFVIISYLIVHYCAASENLPQTMYTGDDKIFGVITRPWDMISLIFFLINVIFVYPYFYKKFRSIFAASLWISAIPDIATQLHMTFGSTALFDNNFNIAHFLKIISYLVPCLGLLLDYIRTYEAEQKANKVVLMAQLKLKMRATELSNANSELERFVYISSHDLKSPLRAIDHLASWIEEDKSMELSTESKDNLSKLRSRINRMETLINDLLRFSKVGKDKREIVEVNIANLINEIKETQMIPEGFQVKVVDWSPTFTTLRTSLYHVFDNLISNAIKHHHDQPNGSVEISCNEEDNFYKFFVKDNGPGFDVEYKDKAFTIFQTLQSRDKTEGSGIGLAIVKKMVEAEGGTIDVESKEHEGANFIFTWPKIINTGGRNA